MLGPYEELFPSGAPRVVHADPLVEGCNHVTHVDLLPARGIGTMPGALVLNATNCPVSLRFEQFVDSAIPVNAPASFACHERNAGSVKRKDVVARAVHIYNAGHQSVAWLVKTSRVPSSLSSAWDA